MWFRTYFGEKWVEKTIARSKKKCRSCPTTRAYFTYNFQRNTAKPHFVGKMVHDYLTFLLCVCMFSESVRAMQILSPVFRRSGKILFFFNPFKITPAFQNLKPEQGLIGVYCILQCSILMLWQRLKCYETGTLKFFFKTISRWYSLTRNIEIIKTQINTYFNIFFSAEGKEIRSQDHQHPNRFSNNL